MAYEYKTDNEKFYEDGLNEVLSELKYDKKGLDLNIDEVKKWFSTDSNNGYNLINVYWVDPLFEYVRIHSNGEDYLYESVSYVLKMMDLILEK